MSLLQKLICLIAALIGASMAIGGVSLYATRALKSDIVQVDEWSAKALAASDINRALASLSRLQYQLAATPTGATADYAETVVERTESRFRGRLDIALGQADAASRPTLQRSAAAFDDLATELDTMIAAVRAGGGVSETALTERFLADARAAYERVRPLETAVSAQAAEATDRAEAVIAVARADSERFQSVTVGALVVVLGFGAAMGGVLGWNGISRPLRHAVTRMRQLGAGDTEVDIEGADRRDEIGDMARAMESFKQGLIDKARLETEAAQRAEQEAIDRRQRLRELAQTIEERIGEISNAVSSASTELQAAAQQSTTALKEANAQTTAVSSAAEQANANVQTVAAASEELAVSVSEISQQVSDAARRASDTATAAEDGQRELEKLSEAMGLVDAVIADISGVAEQTNLLALNATIEAARAGEAGKGFAVVAAEVKSLAQQTQQLTETVSGRIESVRATGEGVVDVMRRIIRDVQDIREAAAAIATAVEQQGSATGEISRNAAEAAQGTQNVSDSAVGIVSAAEQTTAASAVVTEQAERLHRQATSLSTAVRTVVGDLRAV